MQNTTRLASNRHPPRRKACGQCFRSKRRCSQEVPACSRCKKLKVDCEYLLQQPEDERPAIRSSCDLAEFLGNDATPQGQDSADQNQPILEDNVIVRDLDDDEFLNSQWDRQFCAPSLQMQELPDIWLSPQPSSSFLPTLQDQVWQDLSHEAESRLLYGIGAFKKSISQMVLENSTPWSHPLLYRYSMPTSMSDAHAACAIYMNKNDTNKHFVYRAIHTRATELLQATQASTPVENLARVQSLILYQIMRLYDEDIRFRAQGEAALEHLELYNHELRKLINDHGMTMTNLIQSPPIGPRTLSNPLTVVQAPSHATWIFQESCRRTLLLSHFFIRVYRIIKDGGGACAKGFLADPGWAICAPLWEAPSEFDFKIAWKEKRRFIIRDLDMKEVLRDAVPDEVDDFGKIFLVGCHGRDEMREWFHERGGKLVC